MKRIILLFFVVSMFGILSNCGYKLSGFGSQMPDYIKTIHIPDFENKTTRFQAEQFVTFAVRDEFIKRSRLALVDSRSKAHALLEGEILHFEVKPISSTRELTANQYKVKILLSVRLIDLKNNKVLYDSDNVSFVDTYEIDTGDFFSQESKSLKDISEKFAESVVTAILENF